MLAKRLEEPAGAPPKGWVEKAGVAEGVASAVGFCPKLKRGVLDPTALGSWVGVGLNMLEVSSFF